jgi:carboxylate-amine ligase
MSILRYSLAEIVESLGLRLIASGTHPLGIWDEQLVVDEECHAQLAADLRVVAQRSLVCGLQVHVALPSATDRVDLMNRLLRWLPLFLALSTSSPFWKGRFTGLLSYRQALYDERPGSGVPDFFHDEADYAAFTERMQRAGAIRDTSQISWAISPAADVAMLELRIADACTHVEDSLAIAALFRCLVAAAIRHPSMGSGRTTHTRRIIDENRWRAKRDGINAQFIAQDSDEALSVAQTLERTLALVADVAADLECCRALEHLSDTLCDGTSAHRQLRIYQESCAHGTDHATALRRVVAWLEVETVRQPAYSISR